MAKKGDFRPDPTALDDMAPVPVAPMPELPTIQEDLAADETEDDKLAQAYWHPAWGKVQKMFEDVVERYGSNNAIAYKDLPPVEFQIKLLTEAAVSSEITKIMEDVKRAVESVESRPKPGKQPKSGA